MLLIKHTDNSKGSETWIKEVSANNSKCKHYKTENLHVLFNYYQKTNTPVVLCVFVSESQQVGRPATSVTHHHRYRRLIRQTVEYRPDRVTTSFHHQTDDWRTVVLRCSTSTSTNHTIFQINCFPGTPKVSTYW